LEKHYFWRRKTFTLSTVVGTKQYDLAADAGPNADDFAEMEILYLMNGDQIEGELAELVDLRDQAKALQTTTNAAPSGFFIKPGTTQTLHLNAPADSVKTLLGFYWAIPNPAVDTSIEVVPLIPGQLHFCLVTALERSILRFLYGQGDTRYAAVELRYQQAIQAASRIRHWSTAARRAFTTGEPAVRAT